MGVAVGWRAGVATDTGLVRASNEDRYWMDEEHGAFLVVDGVGGHAAGDTAADTGYLPDRTRGRSGRSDRLEDPRRR